MDTNQIAAMLTQIAENQKRISELDSGSSDVLIWTIIAAALAPTLLAFANWLKSKANEVNSKAAAENSRIAADNSKAAADSASEAKAVSDNTAKVVEKSTALVEEVAKSVNGGYGAMVTEISTLKAKTLSLEKEKATLEERQRGQAEAKLIAQVEKEAVQAATVAKVVELQKEIAQSKTL